MKFNRKDLILQAKSSCAYQDDLSCDSIKRYVRCCEIISNRNLLDFDLELIIALGALISPKNDDAVIRCTPVIFRDGQLALDHRHIVRQLNIIIDAKLNMLLSASDFFIAFEKIHPFNDGNGRVGEIIYWWMTGNFNCPHSYFSNHD